MEIISVYKDPFLRKTQKIMKPSNILKIDLALKWQFWKL